MSTTGRCSQPAVSCTTQCSQGFLCASLLYLVFSGKPAAFFLHNVLLYSLPVLEKSGAELFFHGCTSADLI
ncbi:uncharacterized [Tachysurus ichikawai]